MVIPGNTSRTDLPLSTMAEFLRSLNRSSSEETAHRPVSGLQVLSEEVLLAAGHIRLRDDIVLSESLFRKCL